MLLEQIDEPVEVISYFDGERMRPLRFRWRGRAYRVRRVNGVWSDIKGRIRRVHFHVSVSGSGSFELIYDHGSLGWRLGNVALDD